MKWLYRACLFISFPAFFLGCNDLPLYLPTTPPVPLSTEPWQLSASGFYGTTGLTGRAVLAFPDHIQISAAYTKANLMGHSFEAKEALAGLYFQYEDFVFEAFGGIGEGEGWSSEISREVWNFNTIDITKRISGKFDKKIVQINIGRKQETFNTGFFLRASELQMHDLIQTHTQRGIEFSGSPKYTIYEPGVFTGVGKKTLYYYLMFIFPITPDTPPFYISPYVISLGIVVQIGL